MSDRVDRAAGPSQAPAQGGTQPLLDAAMEYCRRGFAPVPLPDRAKRPLLDGWQTLRITEGDAHVYFNGRPGNIGLLCGEASGNYVDVDLDAPEAVKVAPHFLPRTAMVHGRPGSPRSHWGYRVPRLPRSRRFKDADGTVILELWTGVGADAAQPSARQIVAPPSRHAATGEPIVWHKGCRPDPELVEGPILEHAVRRVAAAALLARHWPARGSRQQAALALAGWLLRSGLHPEDVETIVEAAASAAGDEEAGRRVACVAGTAKRLAGGGNVVGGSTLVELLQGDGSAVFGLVRDWLGLAPDWVVEIGPSHGRRTCDKSDLSDKRVWPDPPAPEAFAGLAGRIVAMVDSHTEADPVAVLGHLLAAVGVAVGRGPHALVGATRHTVRVNVVVVGDTSKARKGESASHMRALFAVGDPAWERSRVVSGLSTGEGLIWAVRDPIFKTEPRREGGKIAGHEEVMIDRGVDDKRLLVLESEMARVLQAMSRQANTLSAVIREAYDTGNLRTMTKVSAAEATGAHIGIVGHITVEELRRELGDTEMVNGFANRFLWLAVRRSKLLAEPVPFGGIGAEALGRELGDVLAQASQVGLLERDAAARELWHEVYPKLAEARGGLLGAILARSEAHVLRLSMLYALLDRSGVVEERHLRSALALWAYVERSVEYIFGDASGDPLADVIARALAQSGEMTRSQIRDLFGRHERASRIDQALQALVTSGRARMRLELTPGRSAEIWSAAE